MKKHKFTIRCADGKVYEKYSYQRVLNIQDTRDTQKPSNRPSVIPPMTPIHMSFFEQLTVQISPCIFELVGTQLPKTLIITCTDELFVKEEDCFNILCLLSGKLMGEIFAEYFWVKCSSKFDPDVLKQEGVYKFSICDAEEAQKCSKLRFCGRGDLGTNLVERLKEHLKQNLSKQTIAEKESSSPCADYPDVVIKLQMGEKITSKVKSETLEGIKDFIKNWNSNAENYDKIHDAFLLDNSKGSRSISIFVDFGNCDPTVLIELIEYIDAHIKGIKKITLA